MRQLDLTYRAGSAGEVGWQAMLEALRSAVAFLGQKEVCFEVNVSKSTLSEALNEKNDKRWAGEWTCTVLAMLARKGDADCVRLSRAIVEAQVALVPCFVVADANDMPTQAEIEAAKRVIAKAERRAA